ncbi:MAG: polymerase [Cyanobacteria bacterium RYN_339]|nr:polymerase [Cyanobacteria bacterium RYN_339]
MSSPLLILIDGHALAYRAYFALMRGNFSTKAGHPTGAIFGFTKMLLEAIVKLKPQCLAVSFDLAGPTFRDEMFDAYKGHRAPMENNLVVQLDPIRDVVRAFDIPIYEQAGFEADDVIGTVATRAAAEGYDVLILTGDRDAFQLVTDKVKVLYPKSGASDLEVYGPAEVLTKMGVRPDQIPDLKGLMGDSSDNIPGVPGIGEKGAVKLLLEFETMENIYKRLDEVKGKVQDKLREHEQLARLSLTLATIDTNAPVDVDFHACKLNMPDLAKLTAELEKYELTSILRQLPQTLGSFGGDAAPAVRAKSADAPTLFDVQPSQAEIAAATGSRPLNLDVTIVDTEELLEVLNGELAAAPQFTYDTETDGLQSVQCALVGVAIAVGGPEAKDCRCFYVPVKHEGHASLPWERVRAVLAPHFADPNKTKVAHNAKFDINVLIRHGLPCGGLTFDTMIADYLVYSGRPSHGLKELAWEHLRYEQTDIKALIGTGAKAITMDRVPVEKAAPYAAADVAVTTELRAFLGPKLPELNQEKLFREIELPLIDVLVSMEQKGVRLDVGYLKDLGDRLGTQLQAAEAKIHELAGEKFNINSPKQLAVILFEKLGLPVIKRTKTGISTDAEVLEELADSHEIVASILEFRQLGKLKSTYVDALPLSINPATGRIHTSYSQTVAATGRLSSNEPNLQNIPIRTELGREIRRAFVPGSPGRVFVAADYSQVELRILAHITQDPTFVKAFRDDMDIHAVTASEIFNVPLAEVTSDQRRRAKTTNFGIIYGQSDFGLSKALRIPRKEAKDFIEKFNARYPGVQHYMIRTIAGAKRQGYVETLSGRRRYIPEVNSANRTLRDFGERMAINAPIQGTSADIIKIAMVRLQPQLAALGADMLLQVHDELVFEVDADKVEALTALVREVMESAFSLTVPLKVDVHAGENWREAK